MTKPSDQNDLAGYLREPIEDLQDRVARLEADMELAGHVMAELLKAIAALTPKEEETDDKQSEEATG